MQRITNTNDLDTLLVEGKSLISEGKKRLEKGGLDAKMSGDLSNLIARLEAVTGRLESVADKSSGGASAGEYFFCIIAGLMYKNLQLIWGAFHNPCRALSLS